MESSDKRLEELQEYFETYSAIKEFKPHTQKVHSVGFSCDGNRIGSSSADETVAIYSIKGDRIVKERSLYGHDGAVDALEWHHSHPDLVATASSDRTVRIWDARTYRTVSKISTKGENINISYSTNGNAIAVGSKDNLVSFIDTRTNKVRAEEKFNFEINEIVWSKTSDLMYLATGQGSVVILNYPDLEVLHSLNTHPATNISIDIDPSGKYFAVGAGDGLASIWQINELCCVGVLSNLNGPVRTLSFSHDSQLIASGSEDLFIDISCMETGEQVCDIKIKAPALVLKFHPKQYLLAYACDELKENQRYAGNFRIFGFKRDDSDNIIDIIDFDDF